MACLPGAYDGRDGCLTAKRSCFNGQTRRFPSRADSIALDPSGETLYVFDNGNNRVRAVALADGGAGGGTIRTLAGNGSGFQFSGEGDGGAALMAPIGAAAKPRL